MSQAIQRGRVRTLVGGVLLIPSLIATGLAIHPEGRGDASQGNASTPLFVVYGRILNESDSTVVLDMDFEISVANTTMGIIRPANVGVPEPGTYEAVFAALEGSVTFSPGDQVRIRAYDYEAVEVYDSGDIPVSIADVSDYRLRHDCFVPTSSVSVRRTSWSRIKRLYDRDIP